MSDMIGAIAAPGAAPAAAAAPAAVPPAAGECSAPSSQPPRPNLRAEEVRVHHGVLLFLLLSPLRTECGAEEVGAGRGDSGTRGGFVFAAGVFSLATAAAALVNPVWLAYLALSLASPLAFLLLTFFFVLATRLTATASAAASRGSSFRLWREGKTREGEGGNGTELSQRFSRLGWCEQSRSCS
jgi:hypothetical protein